MTAPFLRKKLWRWLLIGVLILALLLGAALWA